MSRQAKALMGVALLVALLGLGVTLMVMGTSHKNVLEFVPGLVIAVAAVLGARS